MSEKNQKPIQGEKGMEKELEETKKQAAEYLAGWQRARADYENFKKETESRGSEIAKFATLSLIMELLPILNNFKLATDHIPEKEKDSPWVTGLMHIKKQMIDLLQKEGIEEIKTVGEKFDPKLHEAVQNGAQGTKDHIIVKELLSGYTMHGKVIQAAKVIVK